MGFSFGSGGGVIRTRLRVLTLRARSAVAELVKN